MNYLSIFICSFYLFISCGIDAKSQIFSESTLNDYLAILADLDSVIDSSYELEGENILIYPAVKSFLASSILCLESIERFEIQKPDSLCRMKINQNVNLQKKRILIPRSRIELDRLNSSYLDIEKIELIFSPLLDFIPCELPCGMDSPDLSLGNKFSHNPLVRSSYIFSSRHPLHNSNYMADRHMYFNFWLNEFLFRDIYDSLDYTDTYASVDLLRVDTLVSDEFAIAIFIGYGEIFPHQPISSVPLVSPEDTSSLKGIEINPNSDSGVEIDSELIPEVGYEYGLGIIQIQIQLFRHDEYGIFGDGLATFEATYLR